MAQLPCLELLAATPHILRGLISGLNQDDVHWKPAPDRFSIGEVLAHLSHSEWHCYRRRIDQFLSEERPELEPDEASFHLELYRNTDPKSAIDHFEEQRQNNIEYLRGLPASAGRRLAYHKGAATEITLENMLHECAMHDLGHIRQIAELVRARKHWEGAGPLNAGYKLRP
ncbi:MAG: DinB family protein [Candidatus Korobacteraceae bacterium]